MRNGRKVVVVVPAFDEGRLIARTLAGLPSFVDGAIVVDDASRDDTAERARAVGDSRVTVLRRVENGGVGAAIVDGYRRFLSEPGLTTDACVVMAGDAQMDPADLPALLDALDAGADYAKGNRFLRAGTFSAMPLVRWVGNRALSAMTRFATGYRLLGDSQCGYAAATRDVLSRLPLERLWPRYGFPNDLLVKLACVGADVRDVPVRAVYGDERSKLVPWRVAPSLVRLLASGRRERLAALRKRPTPRVDTAPRPALAKATAPVVADVGSPS